MAQRTVLVDDLDGTEGAETLTFSIRGVNYEIDLSEKNTAAFDKAVDKFVAKARRTGGRAMSARKAAPAATGKRANLNDVRAWAREQGYEVSERGRVAGEILEAYDAR